MITKGETLELSVGAPDALSVEFRFGGASTPTAAAATLTDGLWKVTIDTASWTAGNYVWQAWGTFAGSVKRIVASEAFTLAPALATGDLRTTAAKIVEMIEAQMAGNASEAVRRYRINNRELERYSVGELMQLLGYWKNRLKTEQRKARGQSALGPRIEIRI